MSETNERSVASAGSVCEPLAFAVMQPDSYVVVHSLHSAFAMRDMCAGGEVVPLYRSPKPALTDAERTLICRLAAACEGGHPREWTNRALTADDRATLRGLLERLG